MTPAEKFIDELGGVYKDKKVLAVVDVIDKFWGDVFGATEDIVRIRPMRSNDDIGGGAGQEIHLTFPKQ